MSDSFVNKLVVCFNIIINIFRKKPSKRKKRLVPLAMLVNEKPQSVKTECTLIFSNVCVCVFSIFVKVSNVEILLLRNIYVKLHRSVEIIRFWGRGVIYKTVKIIIHKRILKDP